MAALIDRTTEPVVVFTEFRDSLDVIRRRLRFSRAISILHGGQDAAERRQQLAQFLDGSTSVLLATDVAGQGLNLQSRARWVVSLELPWNPTRLEQRIGRVDRISQTRPTHFTLLVARDEAESGLLAHLSRRVLAAQRSFSDDALAGVTPPESAVREALLRQPDAAPAVRHAPVPLCRRWERLARRAAQVLVRRRALTARWRAPDPASASPVCCAHPRSGRLVPRSHRALLVFTVPIVDAGDRVIERRLVAIATTMEVAVATKMDAAVATGMDVAAATKRDVATSIGADAGEDARALRALAVALRPRALEAASRRVAAVARRVRAAADGARQRELALAAAMRAELLADEVQPGLFDRRESRAFETRREHAGRAEAGSTRQLARGDRAGHVRAEEPVLELILSRRR